MQNKLLTIVLTSNLYNFKSLLIIKHYPDGTTYSEKDMHATLIAIVKK